MHGSTVDRHAFRTTHLTLCNCTLFILHGNVTQTLSLLRPRGPEERSPSESFVRSPLGAGGAVGFAILDPEAAEGARATQDYQVGGDNGHGADKFSSRSETAPSLRLDR